MRAVFWARSHIDVSKTSRQPRWHAPPAFVFIVAKFFPVAVGKFWAARTKIGFIVCLCGSWQWIEGDDCLFVWLFLQLRTLRSCPTGFKIHSGLNQPHPEKWFSRWNLQKKEKKWKCRIEIVTSPFDIVPFCILFFFSLQKKMFFHRCLFYYISNNIIFMTVWSNTDFLLGLSNCLTAKTQGNLIPLQSFFHSDHWFSNQTLTFPCRHPSPRVEVDLAQILSHSPQFINHRVGGRRAPLWLSGACHLTFKDSFELKLTSPAS